MPPINGGKAVPPERYFVSVRRPARALLGAPERGVAPPDPSGGQALPRRRRVGSPSVFQSKGRRERGKCAAIISIAIAARGLNQLLQTNNFGS